VYGLDDIGQAVSEVHANRHDGKVGVLCLAPGTDLGVEDGETRERHLPQINRFRI
jgi:crotonyl-CoA reductase